MSNLSLTPLIIEPPQEVSSCVIWLHGLGADKYDFQDVAQLLVKSLPRTRFVLPQAPLQAVDIAGGAEIPAWYNITSLSDERAIDVGGIEKSAAYVLQLLAQQRRQGIAGSNIVLAGFSQGGAVVYHTALQCFDGELAGVLALSTYAPSLTEPLQLSAVRQKTPFAVMHGSQDDVILPYLGKKAYDLLVAGGAKAKWYEYQMRHQFCQQQLLDVRQWLHELFFPRYA